ncbi:MAG TPA: FAD-dependent oxidoreductase [Roseiflexaceae bacterium]|nr:FAD-dependent oxidoreductase [Roseiflexaceae bacterium]
MTSIIIIGGGVAGLTAAAQLSGRGLQPLLLEADPEWVGGRLRDAPAVEFEDGGQTWRFPAEHGVHGIWSPYRNLTALLERHSRMPTLIPSREETWIYGRGRTIRSAPIGSAIRSSPVPAPFHYLHMLLRPRFLNILTVRDFAALFRVEGSLLSALAIDPIAEGKALDGMSLADFTAGWSPTLRSLFAGLARNALAAHPEATPAAGFIAFLRFYTLLRRDAWGFGYLPGTGGACIAEPLADIARAQGSDIHLGWRATRLDRRSEGWLVDCAGAGGDIQTHAADRVVLALDAPAAARLLADSPATAAEAARMRFPQGVPTAIIRLWFNRAPRPVADSGICTGDFLMDNFFWLHRLQPAYRDWHAATGGSAVETHIYGPEEALAQPDATLLAQVVLDSYRAFPELRGHLRHAVIQRNPATHTLFTPGDPAELLAVRTPWPGLVACGDWVAHHNPAMYLERATTTAMVAANLLLEEQGLEPWPVQEHPAPEWLAGWLSSSLTRFRHAMIRRRREKKLGA